MSSGYPCPNPACTHEFSLDSVSGVAALKCPECGNVFHFRLSKAAPRVAAPQPTPSPPTAPSQVADASAILFAPPAEVSPLTVRRSRPKPRGRWARSVVWALFFALSAWLLFAFYSYLRKQDGGRAPPEAALDFEQSNFRFRPPGSAWERDDGPRAALKAIVALRRPNPMTWLAIASRDYKIATPKDGELLQEAEQRLHAYFSNVEWERKPDEELAQHRALRLVFTGEHEDVPTVGECYALGTRGFGYWFFTWTTAHGETRAAAATWSEVRRGFALGRERENWQEKRAKLLAVSGKKANYSIRYAEGTWEVRAPQDYDADGDVALFGQDRSEGPDAGKAATVLVLVLPPQGDLAGAVDLATKHLQSRQPAKAKVETLAQKETDMQDRETHVGNAAGQIRKLSIQVPDSSYQRFVLLAVVQTANETLAIQCECAWERRSYWEPDFHQLVSTFELKN
jgi:hypothetical protein